jgi:hypothetical protein
MAVLGPSHSPRCGVPAALRPAACYHVASAERLKLAARYKRVASLHRAAVVGGETDRIEDVMVFVGFKAFISPAGTAAKGRLQPITFRH